MTEVLFYHLQGQKLEGVLTPLIEKSVERGWRVAVQGNSEERIEALDAHLWTYREDGFLPHGTWREAEAAQQPVLLTVSDSNPNAATVRILFDGAGIPADAETYVCFVVLLVIALHCDAPAALERLLDQRREHANDLLTKQ